MKKSCAAAALAAFAIAGCKDAPTAPVVTTLQYSVTSPFCGPITYTIQFSIDSVAIGSEQLKHGQSSKIYDVSPGKHRIGARIVNWSISLDTTITLTAGQSYSRVIDLYCS